MRRTLGVVAVVAAGWLAACGASARETITRDTVKTTVKTTVDELGNKETWQKLQEPARGIAGAVTDGVIDGVRARLGTDDKQRAIDAAIDHYVDQLSQAVASALDEHAGPAIERAVRRAVHGILDEALSAPNRAAAADLANRIVVSALGAAATATRTQIGPALREVLQAELGPALSTVLTRDLGPAMQTVLVANLGPGLRSVIDNNLTPSLANLAEKTSASAVRGAAESAHASFHKLLDRVESMIERGERGAVSIAYTILAAALAALVAVLGMLAFWLWRSGRGHRDRLTLVADELDRIRIDPAHAPVVRGLTDLLGSERLRPATSRRTR